MGESFFVLTCPSLNDLELKDVNMFEEVGKYVFNIYSNTYEVTYNTYNLIVILSLQLSRCVNEKINKKYSELNIKLTKNG